MLIIDCHGHYTTAPDAHQQFRDKQLARLEDPSLPLPSPARVSDDEIRETIEKNQLKLQRDRGGTSLLLARASAMASHRERRLSGGRARARSPQRVVDLYPENFVGVCQLPQSPAFRSRIGGELKRADALGFVGCNLTRILRCPGIPALRQCWYVLEDGRVDGGEIHVSASAIRILRPRYYTCGHDGVSSSSRRLFRDLPTLRSSPARRRARCRGGWSGRFAASRTVEAAIAATARDEERVLRHLRLPTRHRFARRGDRMTKSIRLGMSARCAHRSADRLPSTTPSVHDARRFGRRQRRSSS